LPLEALCDPQNSTGAHFVKQFLHRGVPELVPPPAQNRKKRDFYHIVIENDSEMTLPGQQAIF